MSRRARLNIALAVTLLALFLLIHLGQREAMDESLQVAQVDPDAVASLRIEVGDRAPVIIERVDAGWRMVSPLAIPVEERRVLEIFNALNIRSQVSYPADRMPLDDIELGATPRARVVVDGETWTLGGRSPLEGSRYILHGDTVHLATDVLHFRLLGEPAGFASRRPLPPGAVITDIELDGGIEGDMESKAGMVEAWEMAHATHVTASDGLDGTVAGRAVLRVHLQSSERPVVFRIQVTDAGHALVRDDLGLVYWFPQPLFERMTGLAGTP